MVVVELQRCTTSGVTSPASHSSQSQPPCWCFPASLQAAMFSRFPPPAETFRETEAAVWYFFYIAAILSVHLFSPGSCSFDFPSWLQLLTGASSCLWSNMRVWQACHLLCNSPKPFAISPQFFSCWVCFIWLLLHTTFIVWQLLTTVHCPTNLHVQIYCKWSLNLIKLTIFQLGYNDC